jgi:hypothetical protein
MIKKSKVIHRAPLINNSIGECGKAVIDTVVRNFQEHFSASEVVSNGKFDLEKIELIFDSAIWHPNKRQFFLMTPESSFAVASKEDFSAFCNDIFGEICSEDALLGMAKQLIEAKNLKAKPAAITKNLLSDIHSAIMGKIKIKHQFESLAIGVDMFAEAPSVKIIDGVANVLMTHKPFSVGACNQSLVDDYLAHFKELPKFLDFMAAARFSKNRKRTSIWMHCESDWGKTFLLNVLKRRMRLVVETSMAELEKMMAGAPVGKSAVDFLRAWVLAVDEFKGARSEMKQATDTIPYSPKNQPTHHAQIYLKLYLSAEDVDSLASESTGVENQFAKRFSYYEGIGSLAERELFQASSEEYFNSVESYIAQYLNNKVNDYLAMGELNAANQAEIIINNFHHEYGIGNSFELLSDHLKNIVQEFKDWTMRIFFKACAKQYNSERTIAEKLIYDTVLKKKTRQQSAQWDYYLKSPSKVLECYLHENFNQAERGKLTYKSSQIVKALGESNTIRAESANGDTEVFRAVALKLNTEEEHA